MRDIFYISCILTLIYSISRIITGWIFIPESLPKKYIYVYPLEVRGKPREVNLSRSQCVYAYRIKSECTSTIPATVAWTDVQKTARWRGRSMAAIKTNDRLRKGPGSRGPRESRTDRPLKTSHSGYRSHRGSGSTTAESRGTSRPRVPSWLFNVEINNAPP